MSDLAIGAITGALDGLAARQSVIADNIANVETADFTARRVEFADALTAAVAAGDMGTFTVDITESAAPARLNGNNVNIDDEVVHAARTDLEYSLMTQAISNRFEIFSVASGPVR